MSVPSPDLNRNLTLDPSEETEIKGPAAVLPSVAPVPIEICILAGGLSSRMGREKSRLRLGKRTILQRIRRTAKETKLPTRIIRRDLVKRCGPLGGIFTALKTTNASAVLFLACDMPFVTTELLEKILQRSAHGKKSAFAKSDCAGFPFLLPVTVLPEVETQIARKNFSIQALARKVKACFVRVTKKEIIQVFNINTPADWLRAKRLLAEKS